MKPPRGRPFKQKKADIRNMNDLDVLDYNEDIDEVDNVDIKCDSTCLIENGKCDCCGEDIDDAHENGNFGCDDCNISFKLKSGLLRHRIIIHNEGETYKCSKCTARCPDEQTLKNHMAIHDNSNSAGVFPCPVCHKQFGRRYHLIRHNMQTGCDGTLKASFPCKICLRVFSRKDNLLEHLRAHAGQTKRKKVYTCEYCNEECTGKSILIQHKKIHPGDKSHTHMCDICPKRFPSSVALKKHRRIHTGERPYECKQCHARFAVKESLNRHTRIHTGVKSHSCTYCGKKFIQAFQLKAHMFHHTGEYAFHCNECGQAFNRRTLLNLHVRKQHSGIKDIIQINDLEVPQYNVNATCIIDNEKYDCCVVDIEHAHEQHFCGIKCEMEEMETEDTPPELENDNVNFQPTEQHSTVNSDIVISDTRIVNDVEVPDCNEDICEEDIINIQRDPACLIDDEKYGRYGEHIGCEHKAMKQHFCAFEINDGIKCETEETYIDDPPPGLQNDDVYFQMAERHLTLNGDIVIADMINLNDLDVPGYNDYCSNEDNVNINRDPACLIEDGKCDCCGEDIKDAHVNGNFRCVDCDISFKQMSGLIHHRIVIHNAGETYECSNCMARCPDEQMLKTHMAIHDNNNSAGKVSCPVCHKQFSRRYHLIRHNMQTGCDGTPKPVFQCQVCLLVFNRKDNLREHLRAHAGQTKRKKVYTCEFCNEKCTGNSMLIQHKKMHTGNKPHMCDICAKRFPSWGALKKHCRKHTGERPYECKQCYARFSAKETLNRHSRIHTDVKPHSCSYCGKGFIQASLLRAHLFHHTGEYGFHCKQCGKAFNRRRGLNSHVKYVHERSKPFSCKQCERTFVRKENLVKHQILHSENGDDTVSRRRSTRITLRKEIWVGENEEFENNDTIPVLENDDVDFQPVEQHSTVNGDILITEMIKVNDLEVQYHEDEYSVWVKHEPACLLEDEKYDCCGTGIEHAHEQHFCAIKSKTDGMETEDLPPELENDNVDFQPVKQHTSLNSEIVISGTYLL